MGWIMIAESQFRKNGLSEGNKGIQIEGQGFNTDKSLVKKQYPGNKPMVHFLYSLKNQGGYNQ